MFWKLVTSHIRASLMSELITKLEALWDDYYSEGDYQSADVVVDVVAWLQDDVQALEK
jgi:hypothetical protein